MTSVEGAIGFMYAIDSRGIYEHIQHIDEIMQRIFRVRMYSLMSHAVCSEAMLLNVLYWRYFDGPMHCPVTGKPLVGHSLLEPPWIRNRLLEQIVEWWVMVFMTQGDRALLDLPDFMNCPITQTFMGGDIYMLTDGTSYSNAVLKWLKKHVTSPLTRLDTRVPTTSNGIKRTLVQANQAVQTILGIIQRRRRLFLAEYGPVPSMALLGERQTKRTKRKFVETN